MSTAAGRDPKRASREQDNRHEDGHAEGGQGSRPVAQDPRALVARQQERFGGIKPGSAFFGWLTATGTAVLLTALVAAAGLAIGVSTDTTTDAAASAARSDAETVGISGAIALAIILFVSFFCGGYVAGRMARFNGAKQGLAVWLWAVLVAVLIAAAAAIAGGRFDVPGQLNTLPQVPLDPGTATTAGVIALVASAVVSLVAAILGGITGMRYHRRIDDATPALSRSPATDRRSGARSDD